MKKGIWFLFAILLMASVLAACGSGQAGSKEKVKTVKIGVNDIGSPVWNVLKKKAKEKNIDIHFVNFSDYVLPNKALVDKEIDMNAFQHLAFLSQSNVENKTDIVPVGSMSVYPMGIYSKKYKHVKDIPDGSKIAIHNDPANEGRALLVLQAAGLIKLKAGVGIYGTPGDIIKNPKHIKIIPTVAQQTVRALPDVAAAVLNGGIAGQGGLLLKQAIYSDDPYGHLARPYVNVFAVRKADRNNKTYKEIAKLYQDPAIAAALKKDTKGGGIVVNVPQKTLQQTLDSLEKDIKAKKAKK